MAVAERVVIEDQGFVFDGWHSHMVSEQRRSRGHAPYHVFPFSLAPLPFPRWRMGGYPKFEPAGGGATRRPEADSKFEIRN
jgi:hypothetical protein